MRYSRRVFFEYGLLAIQIGAALLRNAVVKVMGVFSDFVHGLWDAEKPFEYLQNIGKKFIRRHHWKKSKW